MEKETFESNLKELEAVVKALESSDVSLDDMLSLFEKGIKLTKSCTTQLENAEQKISVLSPLMCALRDFCFYIRKNS